MLLSPRLSRWASNRVSGFRLPASAAPRDAGDAIAEITYSMERRIKVLSVVVLLACCGLSAQQADRSDADALSRRAADRLKTLHDEAERLAAQEKSLLGELRKLEVDRQIKSEELRQAEADAARVAAELAALDRQIATLADQARNDIPDLRARLVTLYKLGQRALCAAAAFHDRRQPLRPGIAHWSSSSPTRTDVRLTHTATARRADRLAPDARPNGRRTRRSARAKAVRARLADRARAGARATR